jgi:hypothetical protein
MNVWMDGDEWMDDDVEVVIMGRLVVHILQE